MAVPNTTTFSLQDVVNEVNPTTDDLVDCFADAISAYFDPAYSGSTNSLLNFRNYGAPVIESSILVVGTNSATTQTGVWSFVASANTYSLLSMPATPTFYVTDIAHTATKLWLYTYDGAVKLGEWDITLSPWNAVYNRTISGYPVSSGLAATTGSTMVAISGSSVWECDITTTASSNTFKFNLITGSTILGDYILTTTNKLIVLATHDSSTYITQYSWPDGAVEVDINIATLIGAYGLYQYNNEIYINERYKIYKIALTAPYGLTYISINDVDNGGTSQIPSLLTVHFDTSGSTFLSAPTGLVADALCQISFTLSWSASSDNIGVTGYKIYKNGSLYKDAGLVLTNKITRQTAGATNTWKVSAYDLAGNESALSTGLDVTQSPTVYSIILGVGEASTGALACAQNIDVTYYKTVDSTITPGHIIYTDPCATNLLVGGNKYWSNGTFSFQVPNTGVITNLEFCTS